MNYRHAFHAGNFADVFKHALMTRILVYLMRKDAPLHMIDTHAGIGLYDLSAEAAVRTGEWRQGIARLAELAEGHARDLLKPYLDCVGALDGEGKPVVYPGSPLLAQTLLRPQDRITLCELHPEDAQTLRINMGQDRRVAVRLGDGYVALNALVPPRERRGLVLIDPPFEQRDEFFALEEALLRAYRKWPSGTYAVWYPLKDIAAAHFAERLAASGLARILRLQIDTGEDRTKALSACGLIIINPPHVLAGEAAIILPALARTLGQRASYAIDWMAGDNGSPVA